MYDEVIKPKTIAFRIKTSAKAFKALIDSTYSKKIDALIREVCSNAIDSHNASGNGKKKFEVNLPTITKPEFRVRDYGTGISDETMETVYTVLFESTKEDSGVEVGKYGLGCKAPFAYSDTFTVSSYQNGKASHWVADIQDGLPNVSLIFTEENTSEPNGVEIKVPVHLKDVELFKRVFPEIIKGFDNKPIVTPNVTMPGIGSEWNDTDPMEIDDYIFYSSLGKTKGLWARMGSIIYPIDKEEISKILKLHQGEIRFLDKINGLIDFPIGALEPVPSREHLSYGRDDPTGKSISNALMLIFQKVSNEAEKSFKKHKDDYLSLCVKYSKLDDFKKEIWGAVSKKNNITLVTSYSTVLTQVNHRLVIFDISKSGAVCETPRRYSSTSDRYSWSGINSNHINIPLDAMSKIFFIEMDGNTRPVNFKERLGLWWKKNGIDSHVKIMLFPKSFFGNIDGNFVKKNIIPIDDIPKLPKESRPAAKRPAFAMKDIRGMAIENEPRYCFLHSASGIIEAGPGFPKNSEMFLLSIHSDLVAKTKKYEQVLAAQKIHRRKVSHIEEIPYDVLIEQIKDMLGDDLENIERSLIASEYETYRSNIPGYGIIHFEFLEKKLKDPFFDDVINRKNWGLMTKSAYITLAQFIPPKKDVFGKAIDFILLKIQENFERISMERYKESLLGIHIYARGNSEKEDILTKKMKTFKKKIKGKQYDDVFDKQNHDHDLH